MYSHELCRASMKNTTKRRERKRTEKENKTTENDCGGGGGRRRRRRRRRRRSKSRNSKSRSKSRRRRQRERERERQRQRQRKRQRQRQRQRQKGCSKCLKKDEVTQITNRWSRRKRTRPSHLPGSDVHLSIVCIQRKRGGTFRPPAFEKVGLLIFHGLLKRSHRRSCGQVQKFLVGFRSLNKNVTNDAKEKMKVGLVVKRNTQI